MTDRTADVVLCRDAVGRTRWLTLFTGELGVVIVAPPGEVAIISLAHIDELRGCLARLAAAGPV